MGKKTAVLLGLAAALSMLTACLRTAPPPTMAATETPAPTDTPEVSTQAVATPTAEPIHETMEIAGGALSLSLPDTWKGQLSVPGGNAAIEGEDGRVVFSYTPDAGMALAAEARNEEEPPTPERREELLAEAWAMRIPLAVILMERQGEDDPARLALTDEMLQRFDTHWVLGTQDGITYTFLTNSTYEESALSADEKPLFDALAAELPLLLQSVQLTPQPGAGGESHSFAGETLDGEPLDSSYFNGYTLTVVCVWTTWCQPAPTVITRLDEIQVMLPDGVGLLGVAVDVTGPGAARDAAAELVGAAAITFPTLVYNDSLYGLLRDVYAYPTLLFADAGGRLVGDPFICSGDDDYLSVIVERMVALG